MIWNRAAIYGANGGIGSALTHALAADGTRILAGSRKGDGPDLQGVSRFAFDLADEDSIAASAALLATDPPDLVIVATGVLTLPDGSGPERSLKHVDPSVMDAIFRLNTIGPALIAKHVLPLLSRDAQSCFVALSARVGSISDNRIGGWHSYRASKAALNMLIRNFAIEMHRTHNKAIIAALHPGTVDTQLSKPFQSNLPQGQLTMADSAARNLLNVLTHLTPEDSGKIFDYKGEEIAS
ncbi:short-chain dehydrogenase [Aurantiacibacter atlanticus]|uniref:Short-chain dehydrogenase n=1 Tax=Aurantiacibacter atlanticus TaxID=1648404 RepID=A0A0H4VH71_9SPHN|nr:SDR family NAD(P)-dependent oxidoreductase [Aurantiacibacter atlanticus]AKQ42191.1 short-chain dehydrogenase [Aurantiacibacter atlanticus]MDF1833603.1 SDR family NAD(P)-dependent oxidoreductase [Alteraurantiacibacter sp. bin_em_oilr2.035]